MSESYLITGGCGLQGSHIVEKLLAAHPGVKIAVMARNPTTNTFPGVDYHRGDITSVDDIRKILAAVRPTVIFHCAGVMTVARMPISDEMVRRINTEGTRLLLEESVSKGVKAFIFTSSASVVQKETFRDILNGDETMPLVVDTDPTLIYAKAKVSYQLFSCA
jgi:sterol-4alpha-carboxylate 3-dehydrogenase (decarboxylating)